MKKIVLAAGCFWGVEHILKEIPGVTKTEVGYVNGNTENPNYQMVCTGTTNFAEGVLVEFDESTLFLTKLLEYFFRLHDPTTLNRQHNDVGTQYRSGIYCYNEKDFEIVSHYVNELKSKNLFDNPIVTEVKMVENYYPAEEYHQKYLIKNPDGYMCHILRNKI